MVSSGASDFALTMNPVEMPSTLSWSPAPSVKAGMLK